MTFAEMFYEVKKRLVKADVGGISEHLAFQFNITGEAEGTFYVEVKDGKLNVEPYEYIDRDVIFTCTAQTLEKIADGKENPMLAVGFGRLKVDGNIDKALKLKEILEKR